MGHIALITAVVVTLLVFQCSATDPYQVTWKIRANASSYHRANPDLASLWAIKGAYIAQIDKDQNRVIAQFTNLQTAYVNGYTGESPYDDYKNIPDEANPIYKPIIVDLSDKENYTILHDPEDPVWSLNMKRAFTSVFLLLIPESKQTLFGKCDITNTEETEDETVVIKKEILHSTCEEYSGFNYGISLWDPTNNNHLPVYISTLYTYYYNDTSTNPEELNEIDTTSTFQYQSMPGVKNYQYITQERSYFLPERTTTFDNIDVSALTTRANITFDFSKGFEGGRDDNAPKKSGAELINEYNERYEEFKEKFNTVPLTHWQKQENVTLYPMYNILYDMDLETLQKLSTDIFFNGDNLYQHLFFSFLPYLGNNASLEFIRNLIENEDENLNDLLAIKILGTFPVYLREKSDGILEGMRPLLNLNVSNSQVKYAGILSFASLVNKAQCQETKQHYFKLYYKHFVDSEQYEVKMTYLLGLINMKEDIFLETIYQICINPEISHHLRVLAIFGFKPLLKSEGVDNYKHFWPIVQNQTEHYEVRAAGLDLLLYSNITDDQFRSIISWYHDNFENPDEQHLANYLYSTIRALENSTGYYDYLGDIATETIDTLKPIPSDHVWTTGNYRMAFTDDQSNFGGSVQTRLIANPNTNVPSITILSVDSFAITMNLGSYTAYIKTQGIPDMGFVLFLLKSTDHDSPVTHLMELIKKHGYKIKDFEEVHIEVVLFCNERVVFGIHFDKNNIEDYTENPLFIDLLILVIDYNSLSFPLQDFSIYSSDLGTSIQISHDMSEFSSYGLENLNKFFISLADSEEVDTIEYNTKYRSLWTYSGLLENYNPIIDASIGNYKFIKEEKLLNIPYSLNLTDFVLTWKHINDSFNFVKDKVLGVSIDEQRGIQYCPNYESDVELPIGEIYTVFGGPRFGEYFGVRFIVKESNKSPFQRNLDKLEPIRRYTAHDILTTHKSHSLASPYDKPFLLLWHLMLYHTFLDEDLNSFSISTEAVWKEPTETVIDLDIDGDNNNDRDPFSYDKTDFTLALTNRKSHNAEILTYFNISMAFTEKTITPDTETQPHVEKNYDVQLYLENRPLRKYAYKVCVNREELYPNRRVDKFSLKPVEPTRATTKLRTRYSNYLNISEDCSNDQYLIINEIYTANERQKQLESLEEYNKCLQQSKGFKFIPPTANCLTAHKIASRYDSSNVYLDINNREDAPGDIIKLLNPELGLKVLEYKRLNNTHIEMSLSQELLKYYYGEIPESVLKETTQVGEIDRNDMMALSPTVIAYNDQDLLIGASSACYISPNQIRTFHGKVLGNYDALFGPDAVAFVECLNETQSGLTIHRVDDLTVGFNFWSENNTVVVTAHDGKVKVAYNGNAITKNDIQNEDFKIYFLDEEVIYVTNSLVDIYYTTEYIALKAPSIYNNYICGLCAGDRK